MTTTPDTGDIVHVLAIGEDWVVAFATSDRVHCCGWPFSSAPLSDVVIVERATPESRQRLLEDMADSDCPHRGPYARRRLATL